MLCILFVYSLRIQCLRLWDTNKDSSPCSWFRCRRSYIRTFDIWAAAQTWRSFSQILARTSSPGSNCRFPFFSTWKANLYVAKQQTQYYNTKSKCDRRLTPSEQSFNKNLTCLNLRVTLRIFKSVAKPCGLAETIKYTLVPIKNTDFKIINRHGHMITN